MPRRDPPGPHSHAQWPWHSQTPTQSCGALPCAPMKDNACTNLWKTSHARTQERQRMHAPMEGSACTHLSSQGHGQHRLQGSHEAGHEALSAEVRGMRLRCGSYGQPFRLVHDDQLREGTRAWAGQHAGMCVCVNVCACMRLWKHAQVCDWMDDRMHKSGGNGLFEK